jgi:hypothetical protein
MGIKSILFAEPQGNPLASFQFALFVVFVSLFIWLGEYGTLLPVPTYLLLGMAEILPPSYGHFAGYVRIGAFGLFGFLLFLFYSQGLVL